MLKNARVGAFAILELVKENQNGGLNYPPPPKIRVKKKYKTKIFLSDYFLDSCLKDSLINGKKCLFKKVDEREAISLLVKSLKL